MENELNQQYSNKEQYQLKKEERTKEQKRVQRIRAAKKILKIVIPLVLIGGSIGWFLWREASKPATPEDEIISRRGIHWHPELAVLIKGQKREVPANLGIGVRHEPIHTHDSGGTLHLEMQGLVKKKDIRVGRFFEIWGKEFDSNCIFEFCNEPGGTVKMFVNGNPNTEFENYQMQDNDKIEIRYE